MKLITFFILIPLLSFIYPQTNYNTGKFEYLSPVPGSGLQLPQTNIIIRYGEPLSNFNINDTSIINVDGNLSGHHNGTLYLTSDFKTIVFQPYISFMNSEKVSVQLSSGLKTIVNTNVDSLSFYFYISKSSPSFKLSSEHLTDAKIIQKENKYSNLFQPYSDSALLFPADFPKVFIKNIDKKDGSYFIGINQSAYNYLAIINNNGIPLYYKRSSARLYDFKIQPSGLLTYYDESSGKFYGMDSLCQVVDSFYCKNGYITNFHDLQVLPNGHSFLVSYDLQVLNMDTVKAGGDTAANVVGSVVQEIDENKVVVWQWRTWDNFKITDADSSFVDFYQHGIHYSHINSIDVVDDNRIIFSVRNFNEITEVDRNTGKINWRFGGYNDQFRLIENYNEFELQHDARLIEGNKLSVFDNERTDKNQKSRVLVYNIDEQNKKVSLLNEIPHMPEVNAKDMGNVQYTPNGNFVIGWGNTGRKSFYMSVTDKEGNLIASDSLVGKSFIYSYRVFKFPWKTQIITSNKDSLIFTNSSLIDSITIKNNSTTSLEIGGIFNMEDFFISNDSFPIEIPPGKEIRLHFKFEKPTQSEVRNTIYIAAFRNNEMASLPVILNGNPTTAVNESNLTKPVKFMLTQNYPNPFNPVSSFSYSLPSECRVKIEIYNILGGEIEILIDKIQSAGNYKLTWDANKFSSGVYFYRIFAEALSGKEKFTDTKKMLLIK